MSASPPQADVEALAARSLRAYADSQRHTPGHVTWEAAAELEDLAARLAETEAQRDEWERAATEGAQELRHRVATLEAALPDAETRDYLTRTIATIRNHRDVNNCWPQWANLLADEIERVWAALDSVSSQPAQPDEEGR